jgi:hypothetical protein
MEILAHETDRACAALVLDLEQRGMLDDTLVVWGGSSAARPWLNSTGATIIFAVSPCGWPEGVRSGLTMAPPTTSLLRRREPCPCARSYATVLYLLGIDHKRLTFAIAAATSD